MMDPPYPTTDGNYSATTPTDRLYPAPLGFEGVEGAENPPYAGFPGQPLDGRLGENRVSPIQAADIKPKTDESEGEDEVLYPKLSQEPDTGSTTEDGDTYEYTYTTDFTGTGAPGTPSHQDDTDVNISDIEAMPVRFDLHTDTSPEENIELEELQPLTRLPAELVDKRETVFFRDGKRRIDFILAYQDQTDPKKIERKKTFEENMLAEGLETEVENRHMSQDGKTYFLKVHATWEVLSRMAELMNMKMPMKEYDTSFQETECCSCLPNPFELSEDILKPEPDFFTADFNRERQDMFIIDDKETFFTPSQRSAIVHAVLLRIQYEPDKDKFGIDRLLKHGVYSAAYPLHEGPYKSDRSILVSGPINDRHLLYETWARPGRWYFMQPLDLVRKYFGEKVGIYFSWLGYYTMMLIPASIVGLIVFLYGLASMFSNVSSEEICDKGIAGNFTMCPLCDKRCSYWRLSSSCSYARLTYLFDNPATVFFAAFMAVWSTMFLEFWKRKQAEIQYDWDLVGYELEEHMRPEFEAKTKTMKLNPVTQMMEPFLPIYSKVTRKCTSFVVILFMICCVLGAVFGVIMYRVIVITLLYAADQELIRQNAKITTTVTAAILNLVVIMLLNRLYQAIAVWLTNLERPRTDSDYEDSFTFKMFLFQFINYYASIFYIAFFKGRFTGHPGAVDYMIGKWKMDECDPAGCLIELCIQLGIVMVGKQTYNNFQEIMWPFVMNWIRSRGAKKHETEENLYTRWEQDKDLTDVPEMGLFAEYLEMVIQYGFVTIFVAAFPLAPLFALINNVIEIRLDAYKLVAQWKKPVASRAQDIGIWFGILQGVSFLAVLTNSFIIGWTSDFVPKLVYVYTVSPTKTIHGYINNSLSIFDVEDFPNASVPDNPLVEKFGVVKYCRYADYRYPPWDKDRYDYTSMYWHVFTARLAFVIVFEHAVFLVTWLIAYLIPDIPGRIKQLMLREYYIAKEARYDAAFSTLKSDIKVKREMSEEKLA